MLPKPLQNLINHFTSLPGIGPRQATRLVFYILKNGEPEKFGQSLKDIKLSVTNCSHCFLTFEAKETNNDSNKAPNNFCQICSNPNRDQKTIAIVADETDVYPIEKTGIYPGTYHILGGLLSPYKNIMPKNLRIKELLSRLRDAKELVIALNPTTEGDATALYLKRIMASHPKLSKIKITRLGRGLPMGSELEYADDETLRNALEGRN